MKKGLFGVIIFMLVILVGCANEDSGPKADGAVMERRAGGAVNWDAFHTFYDNTQSNRPDRIKVVNYTTEGDPITMEVKFTGERFKFTVDSRQDLFGPHELRKLTCGKLSKHELPTGVSYEVSHCFGPHYDTKWPLLFEPKSS